jgi:hypothetical protein
LRDLRDLDGDVLLRSGEVGDNVIAVLARLRDQKAAVTEIVRRIAGLDAVKRDAALGQLIVLAGLRGLEETVEEEIRKMPILNDIMDHKVLGREYKRGRAEGVEEGRQDGIQQGELRMLRRLLEKRFGPIPAWAEERLGGRSAEDLEALSIRLLEAQSLEDLLGK